MAVNKDGHFVGQGRIGDVKEVANQDPKPSAADKYYAVRLQLEDGTEKTALFTFSQLYVALSRAQANPEDIPRVETVFQFFRDIAD